MAATISVEAEEKTGFQKTKEFVYKYRYAIGSSLVAGALYFMGFKCGFRIYEKNTAKSLPELIDYAGMAGAMSYYQWLIDKVPEAARLSDEFIDKNPACETVRDYFMRTPGVKEALKICDSYK